MVRLEPQWLRTIATLGIHGARMYWYLFRPLQYSLNSSLNERPGVEVGDFDKCARALREGR